MPDYPAHENYKPLDANDPKAVLVAFTETSPEVPRDESVPARLTALIHVADLLKDTMDSIGSGPLIDDAKNKVEAALLLTLKHYATSGSK